MQALNDLVPVGLAVGEQAQQQKRQDAFEELRIVSRGHAFMLSQLLCIVKYRGGRRAAGTPPGSPPRRARSSRFHSRVASRGSVSSASGPPAAADAGAAGCRRSVAKKRRN